MKNWTSVKLGEACTILGGGTPTRSNSEYYGGTIPWVTPKDMKTWEIRGAELGITQVGLENSATRLVPANTVLVVVRSGVLKHTIPVAISRLPVAINQDMKAILCSDQLHPDFLARFLKARSPIILQWVRATTADNFPIDKLKGLELPLPPVLEQRRIAEILDKSDELRAKRRAALAQLDILTQSIFLDMFGDPATNPKGWPQVSIGDHARKIGSGSTPLGGKEAYKANGIALIRSMNVRDGAFLRDGLAFIDDEQAARLEGVVVEADDVLLNITGASVARVCRAPADVLPARVNQHVAIIRPTATFSSLFLEQCFLCPAVKHRLLKIARAGATREAITKSAIEQFKIIRPPRELQNQLSDRMVAAVRTQQRMSVSLTELDALFASLQHRAFRGEL